MNKARYFDKCQLIIAIVGLSSMLISFVLFVVMTLTGTRVYDESGILTDITYNTVLQSIFTIFFLVQLIAMVWFIARSITYKKRVKEEDI